RPTDLGEEPDAASPRRAAGIAGGQERFGQKRIPRHDGAPGCSFASGPDLEPLVASAGSGARLWHGVGHSRPGFVKLTDRVEVPGPGHQILIGLSTTGA